MRFVTTVARDTESAESFLGIRFRTFTVEVTTAISVTKYVTPPEKTWRAIEAIDEAVARSVLRYVVARDIVTDDVTVAVNVLKYVTPPGIN